MLASRILNSRAYVRFQQQIARRPGLYADWVSLVNRPWCSELVVGVLANERLDAVCRTNRNIATKLDGIGRVLERVIDDDAVANVLDCMDLVRERSSIYDIVEGIEAVVDGSVDVARTQDAIVSFVSSGRVLPEIVGILGRVAALLEKHPHRKLDLRPFFGSRYVADLMAFGEHHFDADRDAMTRCVRSATLEGSMRLFRLVCLTRLAEKLCLLAMNFGAFGALPMRCVHALVGLFAVLPTEVVAWVVVRIARCATHAS